MPEYKIIRQLEPEVNPAHKASASLCVHHFQLLLQHLTSSLLPLLGAHHSGAAGGVLHHRGVGRHDRIDEPTPPTTANRPAAANTAAASTPALTTTTIAATANTSAAEAPAIIMKGG